MKLHQNILQGIIECLQLILLGNKYTEDVLDKSFRNHRQWGARDRRFIGESVYEIVRWQRWFAFCVQSNPQEPHYCEKLLAVYLLKNAIELPHSFDGLQLNQEQINRHLADPSTPPKIRESIPDWLDDLGRAELKAQWDKELKALNTSSKVALRVNSLKTDPSSLKSTLAAEQVETELLPENPTALFLVKRQNLANTSAYKEGLFEIQDAGSQTIAPFLLAEPGMTVIDACAGAGGKSLHLAALMQNKGKIVSMDVEQSKLEALKHRAARAGAKIIQTNTIAPETLQKLQNTADRLLLDVPCSGLGVLKRNPDAKWKLSKGEIERVKNIQKHILSEYPKMLKKGGILVYATCSILPSENQEQIANFLDSQAGMFELLDEHQVWPSEGHDGFYMARLKKV